MHNPTLRSVERDASGRVGTDFESYAFTAIKSKFNELHRNGQYKGCYNIESTIGTALDKEQGTDFVCDNIMHLDVTTNISQKDNLIYKHHIQTPYYAACGQNFCMNIRRGNNYRGRFNEFDKPVVVLGIDISPREFHANEDAIMENLNTHAKDIIDQAYDLYFTYDTIESQKGKRPLPELPWEAANPTNPTTEEDYYPIS